ncbi:SIA1 Protein SIA1 [Candida maltosa Xu316]
MNMINKHYKKLIIFILICISFSFLFHSLTSNKPLSPDSSLLKSQTSLSTKISTTTNQLSNSNQIITDFTIIKCNHLYSKNKCNNIPKSYIQLSPNEATKIITDISTNKKSLESESNEIEGFDYEIEEVQIDENSSLFKKKIIISNLKNPLNDNIPILRSIDILFGNNDLIDSRLYHKTLHLSSSDSIHTILSLNMMNLKEQSILKESNQQLLNLKNEQIIEFSEEQQPENDDGSKIRSKFKIMQLSDLHFGQDLGRCETIIDPNDNDNIDNEKCTSDLKTLKFIEDSINKESPDLIVITGDLIDVDRSIDYKSILLKSLQPILAKNIKFIYTFGDEIDNYDTKLLIIDFLSTLPNCLNTLPQDKSLYGVTNYNFQVRSKAFKQSASITILDSQDHYLDESQINYLYRLNNEFQNDYKLIFFHYPLPQFRPPGKFKIIGTYNEKHALDSKTNVKFHDDIINCGYNVIAVGHEHENDACILSESSANKDKSIWLCYNSVTGDSGVTKLNKGYIRKLRLFEIDFDDGRLLSWKRKEVDKSAFDYQLIYDIPKPQ